MTTHAHTFDPPVVARLRRRLDAATTALATAATLAHDAQAKPPGAAGRNIVLARVLLRVVEGGGWE